MPERSSDGKDVWRQRVQAITSGFMPDLVIEKIELNQDGLINDVVIANDEYVFRFAKTEPFAEVLEHEVSVLDLRRPRVGVPVPSPIHYQHGCMVYPLLRGQPLLRETILKLDEDTQDTIAVEVGAFLYALHATPLSEPDREVLPTTAPATRERLIDIRRRVRDKVYPLLLPHQVRWAEHLYDSVLDEANSVDYEPVLIHDDLAPYHILYDEERCTVNGILDFGTAGQGDAAQDFGTLISAYGESFVAKMGGVYPGLEKLLPRARFRAQAIELQWVLHGIEDGELFWFTAHLGGARDILA